MRAQLYQVQHPDAWRRPFRFPDVDASPGTTQCAQPLSDLGEPGVQWGDVPFEGVDAASGRVLMMFVDGEVSDLISTRWLQSGKTLKLRSFFYCDIIFYHLIPSLENLHF